MPHESIPAALAIGKFSAEFNAHQLTPEVLARVGRAIVDTCACGIAGRPDEASVFAFRYAWAAGIGGTERSAACWGRSERLPIELAAFYNGVSAHILDYDDVSTPFRGHPSVAMLPALMALGEALDASGTTLAAAYVVGHTVMCRLGRVMLPQHYARGWHSTSSIGSIGCAVACARMLELDARKTAHAIGLAVSQAAGVRGNFGTHAKSFQAGHSNTIGLRAALLAKEGFSASVDILEGPSGYTSLYGQNESLADEISALSDGPLDIERSGIDVKKYPMCYAVDREVDGILAMRAEHGLTLDKVARVSISTTKGALSPLIHQRPTTGLEAKFSMQYAIAAALHDGHIKLSSFEDAAVQRTEVQQFFPAVVAEETDPSPKPYSTHIKVTLHDGAQLNCSVHSPRGLAKQPISLANLRSKLDDCVSWAKIPLNTHRFFERANKLGSSSVRDLAEDICPSSG